MSHGPAHTVASSDGLILAIDRYGPDGGPGVILMHGGGQTRHAWRDTAKMLGRRGYAVASLDLRGHGESGWSPDARYDLEAFRDDAWAVLDAFDQPAVLIGASLGGLASILAAGEDDRGRTRALVLVDVTPEMSDERSSGIRAFMAGAPEGFADLDEAADAVARYLPHRPRPTDHSGLMKNLRWRDGRLHWHWDPAFMGALQRDRDGVNTRLFQAARAIDVPILLVRGADSELVGPEEAEAFRRLKPQAEIITVPDARHMVAGDQNTVFGEAVVDFLQRIAPTQGES